MNQWLLRDGGGSIGEEELGKVMKTFGWDPKEEELKVYVEVYSFNSDILEISEHLKSRLGHVSMT